MMRYAGDPSLRLPGLAAVLCGLMAASPAAASGCEGPATLRGRVQVVWKEFVNASTPETRNSVIQLLIDGVSAQAAQGTGCMTARKIHLVPQDSQTGRLLRRLDGKPVVVRVDEVFEAHTAWHHGDAVARGVRVMERDGGR